MVQSIEAKQIGIGIREIDGGVVLLAGHHVKELGGDRMGAIAEGVSSRLASYPGKMLPVSPDEIFKSMDQGMAAVAVVLDSKGKPTGSVRGFSRLWDYAPEGDIIFDPSTGLKIEEGTLEAGALLGGAVVPGNSLVHENGNIPRKLGRRAMGGVVRLGALVSPGASIIAITRSDNTLAQDALLEVGGKHVASKTTTRMGEVPVSAAIFHMNHNGLGGKR